jgi:HlyD family secretion protein
VRQSATITNNVVTYEVVINAPNPDLKLKPGLTATVSIFTLEKNEVLTIPSEAITFTPENASQTNIQNENKRTVWVVKEDTIIPKEIEIGNQSGTLTEVVSGLSEGEKVVIGSTSGITPQHMDTTKNAQNDSPFMPKPPARRGNGGGSR